MGLNLFQIVGQDKHDLVGKDEGHLSTITTVPKSSSFVSNCILFHHFFSLLTPLGLYFSPPVSP